MKLSEIDFDDGTPIDGYGPGFFRVAGQVLTGPMLIGSQVAKSWVGYDASSELLAMREAVDLVIVGTGAALAYPPLPFREELENAGFAVEFMQTAAACRTYNMLLAEGRRIAAVMLPV